MSTSIYDNPSFSNVPFKLKLRHTITSSGSVTGIPSSVKRVYAVCIGGGASGAVMAPYTTATITNVTAASNVVTYTCANSFVVGDRVTITGVNPSAFNLTQVIITTASSTQFTVSNSATGTYVSGGTAASGGAAGGGGAGGIAMDWTYVPSTCVVAAGGAGFTGWGLQNAGGITVFGNVVGGGGGAGSFGNVLPGNQGFRNPTIGGGAGGCNTTADQNSNNTGATSYYGMNPAGAITISYGGYSGQTGTNSSVGNHIKWGGVAGGGGGGLVAKAQSITFGVPGGDGFHAGGGGGAGYSTTATSLGGTGGRSDFYGGGTGSSGTMGAGGAGGGGAGYIAAGSNASGVTGGNGGDGGGGGGAGASDSTGTSGSGGNGVIYIYY